MDVFTEETLLQETNSIIYNSQSNWPKISIVTPSYNQGKFIEHTILSVLNQNYPNLEYIIIDGGSTDNTVEVIKKYAAHVNYWVSESDNGQAHAINKGISKCTGEIFNWVNSDDILAPMALYHAGLNFIKNASVDVILFPTQYFDKSGLLDINDSTLVFDSSIKSIAFPNLNQMGTFWSLNVINELGGINESLHYIMDLDLWNRFLLKYDQSKIIRPADNPIIGFFRKHDNSKTVTELVKNESSKFYLETVGHYENLQTDRRKKILSYYHFFLSSKYYHQRNFKQLESQIWQINPFHLSLRDLRSLFYIIRKSILNRA